MEKTLIAQLGEYASSLEFKSLPAQVVEKAKICILDLLGSAVGGYDLDVSQLTIRTAKLLSRDGGSRIWIDGHKGKAIDCVLANCVLAHSLFQDDWHPVSHSHIGVSVIPVALALGEENRLSGRDVLTATVLGYEVEGRAGVLSVPAFTRGFRASSVYALFGSTAVAAKLMGLSGKPFQNALGCAGSITGGVLQPLLDGSMEWTLAEAYSCRNGILAALLAKQGLKGADHILEGPAGVNHCFSGTLVDQENTLKDLGKEFQIQQVCFKRFPSGGANQGSIAVALDLAQRHKIDYRRIRAVRVQIPHTGTHERMNYAGIAYPGPFSSIDQCFISKPFGIAATLKNAALDIEIVKREQSNPEVTALAHKIELQEVKGSSGWSLAMEIELDKGTLIRGDGSNIDQSHIYPDRQRTREKFFHMTSRQLGAGRAEQIADLVFRLEELEDISPITERMTMA